MNILEGVLLGVASLYRRMFAVYLNVAGHLLGILR